MSDKAKKAYLEIGLEEGPLDVIVELDALVTPPRGEPAAYFGVHLPLERQLVTFAGVSGYTAEGEYVSVPWGAMVWIGRDYLGPKCSGKSWSDVIRDDGVLTVRAAARARGWRVIDGGVS